MDRFARCFLIAYLVLFGYVITYLVSDVMKYWTSSVVKAIRYSLMIGG